LKKGEGVLHAVITSLMHPCQNLVVEGNITRVGGRVPLRKSSMRKSSMKEVADDIDNRR